MKYTKEIREKAVELFDDLEVCEMEITHEKRKLSRSIVQEFPRLVKVAEDRIKESQREIEILETKIDKLFK